MVGLCGHFRVDDLVPDGLITVHLEVGIGKATDAGHGAKVVVKGTVLYIVLTNVLSKGNQVLTLHEEDDMVNVGQATGADGLRPVEERSGSRGGDPEATHDGRVAPRQDELKQHLESWGQRDGTR